MTQHFAGKALNADVQPARTWTWIWRLRNPARNDGVHRALGTAPPSLLVGKPGPLRPRPVLRRHVQPAVLGMLTCPSPGPRTCIGSHLALMEIQVVLALVASRCRLRLTSDHPVPAQALITTRSAHSHKEASPGGFEPLLRPARRAERRFFAIFATQKALAEGPGRGRSNAHTLFGMTATFARKCSLGLSPTSVRFAPRCRPSAHCPPSPATTISGRCWTGRRRTISIRCSRPSRRIWTRSGAWKRLRRLMGGC